MGASNEARAAKMQPDIFISYASKDAESVVPIARLLEKAGVSVWRDGDRILGGQYYGEQIVQALTHARVVLLICSPDSLASDNVHREMLVNWEYGCRAYVPVWITPPTEIPERFRYCLVGCQWIDAHAEPPDVWLPRLLSALEALGVRAGAGAERDSRTPARKASPATKRQSSHTGEVIGVGKRRTPPPQAAAGQRRLQLSWPILAAIAGLLVVGVVALLWASGLFRSKESTHAAPVAATGSAAGPSTTITTNRFVPLFNGTDLSGWRVDTRGPGDWQMKGGELCARSPEDESFLNNRYMLSARDYKDFVLRFQFLCTTDSARGGIAVRAMPGETARNSKPDIKQNYPFHLTILIGKFREFNITGWLASSPDTRAHLRSNLPAELKPPGQWNDMEIEMAGQHLRGIVNGREVLNVMLNQVRPAKFAAPGLNRDAGRIGFYKRCGELRFRNIEIKELASNTR